MSAQQQRKDECCTCMPYKDCTVITGQALSIVALGLSWLNTWSFLTGLTAFIMLQIVWCCKMNKCGLIVAGVFGCISGVINAAIGIIVLVWGTTGCEGIDDDEICTTGTILASSFGLGAGFLWIASSVCVFVFACGKRYNKFHVQEQIVEQSVEQSVAVKIAEPFPARAAVMRDSKFDESV